MDAFIIRGTLVPAFMRLAGEANWWAPKPLRRFHDRYGFTEHIDLDADTDTDDRADEPDQPGPRPVEREQEAQPVGGR
jgi:RND superfamily putative drug exporter